jgi:hypothetical protein
MPYPLGYTNMTSSDKLGEFESVYCSLHYICYFCVAQSIRCSLRPIKGISILSKFGYIYLLDSVYLHLFFFDKVEARLVRGRDYRKLASTLEHE